MQTDNNANLWKSLVTGVSPLSKICAGFTVATILVVFFERDLSYWLTPYFELFLLIFLFLAFVVLVVVSFIYVLKRFDANPLDAFLPLSLNSLTVVIVIFFFQPLQALRVDVAFKMNLSKYEQIVLWVKGSIQSGKINLGVNESDVISLPKEYKNIFSNNDIVVQRHEHGISIFLLPWGGMFEYSPGFMYRSDDIFPPDSNEIECHRNIQPHWFYCS